MQKWYVDDVMTTKTPRLNITLSEQEIATLTELAKQKQQSISATAKGLISQALKLDEDAYLSKIANTRDNEKTKWITSDDAWQ